MEIRLKNLLPLRYHIKVCKLWRQENSINGHVFDLLRCNLSKRQAETPWQRFIQILWVNTWLKPRDEDLPATRPVTDSAAANRFTELLIQIPGTNCRSAQDEIQWTSPVLRVCLRNDWRDVNSEDDTPGSKHWSSKYYHYEPVDYLRDKM